MSTQSTQRITAENNFMKTQTQSLARNRITAEFDSIAHQRDVNMARQRQQRLEKEAAERQAASVAVPKRRKKTVP
ncbi:hypothetical protein [Bosea sp. Tri-54]|uniref:hypothetical protein n=2 Tax=Bosea TaxID=85413 RepID=UPI000F75D346|nr:hypothetical protein [Bosea sp. Tri-54]AZO81877.1 hypothetical protein BLM15_29100 [Bosea sp. Tri-49]RXT16793.1 hypothetical protein B5U98_26900 [Bosea sp. Tri-39]